MISIWFERGQSYVTRTLRQALLELGHDIFLFTRQCTVWGQPRHETSGAWNVQPRQDHPTYEIQPGILLSWARYHHLAAVVFNEEYAFELPAALKASGVKTIHYMDYLGQGWTPLLRHYDQLWSATHRTYDLLISMQVRSDPCFIGWGIAPGMSGDGESSPTYDFFSNQGWLGINGRKGIKPLLEALRILAQQGIPAKTLIHAQVPYSVAGQMLDDQHPVPPAVEWCCETVPPPGLYQRGRIVVQPSLLEGFGLTLVEAMAAGRPIVTTDAPPMHELVTPETGWLVPVKEWRHREDPIMFLEAHVSAEDLAGTMLEALHLSPDGLQRKAEGTMARARELFDWEVFKGRLGEGLNKLGIA